MEKDIDALRTFVYQIDSSSLAGMQEIIERIFSSVFGTTTDRQRLEDILRQAQALERGLTYKGRTEAFGSLLLALLAFAEEQNVSIDTSIRQALGRILDSAETYETYGSRQPIAIIGGSFDPPTVEGHFAMAKAILDSNLGIHEVWLMPANKYFGSKTLTPAEHRVAMVRLLEKLDPRVKCFPYEVEHDLFSETIATLLKIVSSDLVKRYRVHFVVSTETAQGLLSWPKADELIRTVPFITLPRVGYQVNMGGNLWFLQQPHRYLHVDLPDASSSQFRSAYRSGDVETAKRLVGYDRLLDLYDYIEANGLYRSPSQ